MAKTGNNTVSRAKSLKFITAIFENSIYLPAAQPTYSVAYNFLMFTWAIECNFIKGLNSSTNDLIFN